MDTTYDVLLVSIGDNLVRAILARGLDHMESWEAVEEYGAKLDCGQSFVIDDVAGDNEVGRPYKGFLPENTKGFGIEERR